MQATKKPDTSSHTPGPWIKRRVEGHHGDLVYCHIIPAGAGRHSLAYAGVYAKNKRQHSRRAPLLSEGECDANADLMAAAPELLDACEAAMAHVRELAAAWQTGAIREHDGLGGTRSNRNAEVELALREALAKALGGRR